MTQDITAKLASPRLLLGPFVLDLAAKCAGYVEFYRTFTGPKRRHMILCFRCTTWEKHFLKCELVGSDGPLRWACQVKVAPMADWSPPKAIDHLLTLPFYLIALRVRRSSEQWEPAALAELIVSYCASFGSYRMLCNNCHTFALQLTRRGQQIGKRFAAIRAAAQPAPMTTEEAEALLQRSASQYGVMLVLNTTVQALDTKDGSPCPR
jgi:hypothetical protein